MMGLWGRFEPCVAPGGVQQDPQTGSQSLQARLPLKVVEGHLGWEYHIPGDQLPLHVVEQLFRRISSGWRYWPAAR